MSSDPIEHEFDPLSDYFERNAFAEFKRMRENHPVYRHQGTLMPVVSLFRNDDIRAALRDWKTFSSQRSEEYNKKALGDASILIGNDPPLHTTYRDIVAPLFMPNAVHKMEAIVEEQIDQAIADTVDKGEVDFLRTFAMRVSLGTICHICDVPEKDWPLMFEMTQNLAKNDGQAVFWQRERPDIEAQLGTAITVLTDYFNKHLEERVKNPKKNMLNEIATQIDEPRHLTGLCILLLGAGFETTMNLMANGMQELIRHPQQMQMLRDNPDLIDGAVEEMLRMRGTIRKQDRIAGEDMEIRGVKIYKGESLALWNGSASLDPDVIENPETFDITRKPNRHLAFGSGIHMCIGNVLARMEVRMAFKRLLEATSTIEETRGAGSFRSMGNGILTGVDYYHLKLSS